MNLNILALFAGILDAVKTGEYKQAACQVGQLVSAVTCQTATALLGAARTPGEGGGESAPLTAREFATHCEQFKLELKAACEHSDHLVKTGAASDTALPPGTWLSLANFALQILSLFVKVPLPPLPVPPVVPPAPVPVVPPAPPPS